MQSTNPTPHIRTCSRCKVAYDWRRSASRSLKMTYCSALCEHAGLGFTIEALLSLEHTKDPAGAANQPKLAPPAMTETVGAGA